MSEAALGSTDELWGEGRWAELVTITHVELGVARKARDCSQEADALAKLGFFYGEMGQTAEAIRVFREELRLRRAIGDPEELAQTLHSLSWRLAEKGRVSSSIRCLRLALVCRRVTGDDQEIFVCLVGLGFRLWGCGQLQEAKSIFEEALLKAPQTFPAWGRARVLDSLSQLSEKLGLGIEALALQHRFSEELCTLGQEIPLAQALVRLANLYRHEGKAWEAEELLHEALGVFSRLGEPEESAKVKRLLEVWRHRRKGIATVKVSTIMPRRGLA